VRLVTTFSDTADGPPTIVTLVMPQALSAARVSALSEPVSVSRIGVPDLAATGAMARASANWSPRAMKAVVGLVP